MSDLKELSIKEPLDGNEVPAEEREALPEKYSPSKNWWTFDIPHTLSLVQLDDMCNGVSYDDIPRRARELGGNKIPISGGPSAIWILCRQFMNSITFILAIVIVISAVFRDWAEFGVVLFILLFNALLGFYQEYGAEKSLHSLKEMTAGSAKVLRDGAAEVIFIDEVVVGDIVILEQGASVPADCRLVENIGLEVDEALLTGEALPVVKHTNVIPDPDGLCALGDRKNMVYRNTLVTQGRGKAVVVAAGLHTEVGKLAERLVDNSGSEKTALMKKLDYLMYFLFGCCFLLALVVFAANKFKYNPSTLSYATAVAIAILPESLVAVVTVSMTVSVKIMAKQKCIVRKLAVLEVLGNVTDICSDKTGTLTENKMVVKKAVIGMNEELIVTGAPYERHGLFLDRDYEQMDLVQAYRTNKLLYEFMRCAALCSTTVLQVDADDVDRLTGAGNPTEVAIQVMSWKAELYRDRLEKEGWECIAEYPFDSKVKRMSTVWYNDKKGEFYICTKGAPERVIDLCTTRLLESGKLVALTDADRQTVGEKIQSLASDGLRTICFSMRPCTVEQFPIPTEGTFLATHSREVIEQELAFLGIVGIYDPPRPESHPSVVACQHAGIVVRMLTGDHVKTAGSIAIMLNIINRRDIDSGTKLLNGPDFDRIEMEAIDGWDDLPLVVGRCSPESKVKMIECLHKRNRVVAMTGDGFNDSPSIKISDVGCAMGSGTDVTKGVADLIITDDNFATIVKAVAEGRRISQNIRKFVVHLLSSNVAEVIALICGLPIRSEGASLFVLSPIEILWLNMFTSAPPAIGLSLDAASADVLLLPPNTAGLFTFELVSDTVVYGFWLGVCSLCGFVFIVYGVHDGPSGNNCNSPNGVGCNDIWRARATAFGILYFGLLLHSYTVRHSRLSVFLMKWFDNFWIWGSFAVGVILFFPIVYVKPVANGLFVHDMLTWHWGVLAVLIIFFMAMCEVYKVLKNCFFPLKKVSVAPDEEAMQEYRRFAVAGEDSRDVESIAEEQLRMSFASYAGSIVSGGTHNMMSERKKKRR
ncbi:calcium motive p-type ATPase, putative [Trypanosoma cruzi]|uniref:Calcium motive p-type ATPase, putative n=1 Tax=Trypanosoma cruzi (strain CL Brener) TaxID=353153 RepID=Q4DU38_TRYCC|nr:calcium motive p-type ATPase, putative [Trypanosoma cruzi]EAN96035.1 calcium motive p-type ATPase, putative [Trypanosoma cruzi]|eukprot:XP_817886.1 calcium motive p-type ATPase [Trypanosoma cruzi strain CL Brener]